MNFMETNKYMDHASNCSRRSAMAKDAQIKKFWEALADEWITLNECENVRPRKPSDD
jgi:hypothetical protein